MDGTLVDSHAVTVRIWTNWAQTHGVPVEPLLDAMIGVRAADTVRRFGSPELDADAEAAGILAAEIADLDGIVEISGAARFLATLPPDRWAVVTSASRELARRRLAAAGLPLPRVLVSAEDISRGKPAPDGFLRAAAALGVAPDACVVWEDSRAGIAAAEAAGAAVIVMGAMPHAPRDTVHPVVTDYTTLSVTPSDGGIFRVRTSAPDVPRA